MKKALLVGINHYANSAFDLRGCENDMESLARLLSGPYGFGAGDFEMILNAAATRDTILRRLDALLLGAAAGDTIVFAFSGHGTQVRSTDPGESDTKDECLVPYEASYSSLIKDNELADIFDRYVDKHINFTAIYDCCHSGTMLRTLGLLDGDLIVEDMTNRYLAIEQLAGWSTRDVAFGP